MCETGPVEVRPVGGTVGAEVEGVDLSGPIPEATVAAIAAALAEHHVVFLRGQPLDSPALLAFAERFGPIMTSVGRRSTDDGAPGVTVLDQVAPKGQGADIWHSDHMFMPETPVGTVLTAVQVPPVGGDTCFASMVAAHDTLSPAMQRMLRGLTAVSSNAATVARVRGLAVYENDFDAEPTRRAIHPVVRLHEPSGRLALFVSPRDTERIVELTESESDAVLAHLFAHLGRPDHQCRFRWEVGSVALWDNRAVLHRAVPDYRERRVMRRTMLAPS